MPKKVVIIGSGPAGHTAAIYTARAGLKPLMFEGFMKGGSAGGQLMTTTDVENYPGFPEGISGPELVNRLREQSKRFRTEFITEDVVSVDFSRRPFLVRTDAITAEARSVIIATGATAKRLGLPSEEKLWNRGISACAVCDGALPIFKDKVLVVVGGGDTAMEEALYLTRFASKVVVLHRRDELRASKAMQKRFLKHPKTEILWDTVPVDAVGDEFLSGVRVRNVKSGVERTIEAAGLFYGIGHKPNTEIFEGQIKLDETGYIVTPEPPSSKTSVEGIFAAGDVHDPVYRQAITAAGAGCRAAIDCERWLADHQP